MFEQRIFETDFRVALSEELDRRGLSIRQLSEMTGIPAVTLYKIASGERDPRLSTVKKIVAVFSPHHGKFIALIAAKFLLDENEGVKIEANGTLSKTALSLPLHYLCGSLKKWWMFR